MLDISGQSARFSSPAAPLAAGTKAIIPSVADSSAKVIMFVIFSLVVIVLIAGGYLSYIKVNTEQKVKAATLAVDKLKADLGTPERVKNEAIANQLKQAVTVLQTMLVAPFSWSTLLKELTSKVPEAISLTNISVNEKQNIRINGNASSYQDVSKFLAALKSSDQFKDTALESTSVSEVEGGSVVTFALKTVYAPEKITKSKALNQGAE